MRNRATMAGRQDEDDLEAFQGFLMKNYYVEMLSLLEAPDSTLFYSLSIEYVCET